MMPSLDSLVEPDGGDGRSPHDPQPVHEPQGHSAAVNIESDTDWLVAGLEDRHSNL